ncbi:MAG: sugar phosphate isomerase/epimerase [Ruminococcaceae bacterium]|nr:sugar phosphate isomerase/epimerase [Oscillospiraceae bacterium]
MNYKLAAFADEADGRLSEQIKAMAENGIDFLEIRGVDGENISDISLEKAKEIRRQLEDAGLGVWSLGSPYGKIGICDDFTSHLDKFKHGLELADILGAKHIRMFSFYVPSDDAERYRNEVFRRLECFIQAAKGSDVILCHENEKGIYGDIASRCEEIHREFPVLKAVFDPANFIQCSQDTVEAWEKLSSYVEYMHIKDAMADGSVVPAGKGIGNLPYLLENYVAVTLRKGSVLTLEPHLSVFDGFDKLEASEKPKLGYCYPSSRAAFDAAVNALKELI